VCVASELVNLSAACRAWLSACACGPLPVVNVVVPVPDVAIVKTPAIACSNDWLKLLLVVVPQEPACSPSPISSIFNLVEKVDAIYTLPHVSVESSVSTFVQVSAVTLSLTSTHVNNEGEPTEPVSKFVPGILMSFKVYSLPMDCTVAVIDPAVVAITLVSGVTPAMLLATTFVDGKAITVCAVVPVAEVSDPAVVTTTIAPPRMVAPAIVDVTTCVPAMILASDVVCAENPASEKAANPNIIHPSTF
jgi:hypothetical protein